MPHAFDEYGARPIDTLLLTPPRSDRFASLDVRRALVILLTRIASWTATRWDQHLRNEFGDAATDSVIAWLAVHIEPRLARVHEHTPTRAVSALIDQFENDRRHAILESFDKGVAYICDPIARIRDLANKALAEDDVVVQIHPPNRHADQWHVYLSCRGLYTGPLGYGSTLKGALDDIEIKLEKVIANKALP